MMRSIKGDSINYVKKSVHIVPSAMLSAKIVIVGAGAAGLACATKLLDYGFTNIQILEAGDRIGGRIHSVPFGNAMVDLGAQWCHGEVNNVVYHLAKDRDALAPSRCTYKDNTFYNSRGKIIDKDFTDQLFGIAASVVDNVEKDQSFGHFFLKRFVKKIYEEYGANTNKVDVAMEFVQWFHKLMLCYDSAPSWFAMAAADDYKQCEGDPIMNWKLKGYLEFLNILKHKHAAILEEQIIQFNRVVRTIVWNNSYSAEALIHCKDGSFYDADHIILTVSLGVLKEKYKSMFIPELPSSKVKAIELRGFGIVNKIMLKFPYQWWKDEDTSFCFTWNNADRINILNEFPHGPCKNGKSWLEDINGFFVIDSDPTVLLGWILGEQAAETEKMTDKDIESGCMYLLQKFLGVSYKIPSPESILISRWHENPHFRGSYSFVSVEGDNAGVGPKDLEEPLLNPEGKPVIQFAGEATHQCYFSTVHGAVETGFREASRIFDFYSKKNYHGDEEDIHSKKLMAKY